MIAAWVFHGSWTEWNLENVSLSVALLGLFLFLRLLRRNR